MERKLIRGSFEDSIIRQGFYVESRDEPKVYTLQMLSPLHYIYISELIHTCVLSAKRKYKNSQLHSFPQNYTQSSSCHRSVHISEYIWSTPGLACSEERRPAEPGKGFKQGRGNLSLSESLERIKEDLAAVKNAKRKTHEHPDLSCGGYPRVQGNVLKTRLNRGCR